MPEPIDTNRQNRPEINEADLWAYLDDSLPAEQAAYVRSSLNRDAKLKALFIDILEQHKKMQDVDEKVLSEPIPSRLLKIVRDAKIRTE